MLNVFLNAGFIMIALELFYWILLSLESTLVCQRHPDQSLSLCFMSHLIGHPVKMIQTALWQNSYGLFTSPTWTRQHNFVCSASSVWTQLEIRQNCFVLSAVCSHRRRGQDKSVLSCFVRVGGVKKPLQINCFHLILLGASLCICQALSNV